MPRLWMLIALVCGLMALEQPLEAAAQTRRSGDSRGSTRRASRSRRSSRRVRDGRSSRRVRTRDGWYRRRRRRRRIVGVTYDPSDCDYVRDGYCYYVERVYVGASAVSFGFSLDAVGGVYATGPNGLSSPRVLGDDVDAGTLGTLGGGFRAWLLYDRLRTGVIFHSGGALRTRRTQVRATDVFEDGSELGGAWYLGVWGFGAYQPQLSDLVSLSFGARAGVHTLSVTVDWESRSYAKLERVAFSAGPEVGLMLSAGPVGVMFWGFADLAVPGHASLSAGFVYEEPRPPGAAF